MIALLLSLATAAEPPSRADALFNPRAAELFERDWALMHWARKRFDGNGDGMISLGEANAAATAFKAIADGDSDGRVTPYEYERAREFIIARY